MFDVHGTISRIAYLRAIILEFIYISQVLAIVAKHNETVNTLQIRVGRYSRHLSIIAVILHGLTRKTGLRILECLV